MDSVIVDEDGHAHDVHGHVCGQDEEDALRLSVIDGEDVVRSSSLDPFTIEEEENGGVLVVALGDNDTLLLIELPLGCRYASKDLKDERLVVSCGDHDSSRSRINDRIE